MRKILTVSTFFFVNFSILIATLTLLVVHMATGTLAQDQFLPESANTISATYDAYSALPPIEDQFTAEIISADARPQIIDNFFIKYHSPMVGLGSIIVETADKYDLPYGLLPAIAQCEGNVGKVMPPGSFNTWGWAIYGDKKNHFASWSDGIEKVSKGLRQNYFDKGLNSPDEIMKKYTPSSNGSWASCVNQFLEELK